MSSKTVLRQYKEALCLKRTSVLLHMVGRRTPLLFTASMDDAEYCNLSLHIMHCIRLVHIHIERHKRKSVK